MQRLCCDDNWVSRDESVPDFNIMSGWDENIRSIHDGFLLGSKLVGWFLISVRTYEFVVSAIDTPE